jgi:metal-sulfur cluster biosynthetic enzyme
MLMINRSDVIEALAHIDDPELGMNIVDLGLVYGVSAQRGAVAVELTLTYPGCPFGPQFIQKIEQTVGSIPGVRSVEVRLVWEPPWKTEMVDEDTREELRFAGRIR